MTNIELFDYIKTYGEAREWSNATFRAYFNSLNTILKLMGDINLDELDYMKAVEYLKRRKDNMSVKSANIDLRNLKAIYEVLENSEIINKNPFKKIKPYKIIENDKEEKMDYLLPEEVNRFLSIVKNDTRNNNDSNYIYMLILFYTGLRCSEVAGIKTEDINYLEDEKVIEITVRATKNKKDFTTYIVNRKVVNVIKKWISNINTEYLFESKNGKLKYISGGKNSIQRVYSEYAIMAGIDRHLTCHSARKTFATFLRSNDIGMFEIEQLLNHSVNNLGASTYARMTKEFKIKILSIIEY